MIAATAFVLIGVLGMFITDNKSDYASTMIIGLILGWIGDLFMHIPHPPGNPRMSVVYIGAASFLIGHIFYVSAFVKSTMALTVNYNFFTIPEIIAFFVIFVCIGAVRQGIFKQAYIFKFVSYFLLYAYHFCDKVQVHK